MPLLRAMIPRQAFSSQLKGVSSMQRWTSSTTSTKAPSSEPSEKSDSTKRKEAIEKMKKAHQSMAQADEDMRNIMEGLAGDGGSAGAELEDGKPVAMKRGVRENMFRYI